MGKNKLKRFAEMKSFGNVFEPHFSEVFGHDFFMKGNWNEKFFRNNNPVIIELGCGKGEYTLNLAMMHKDINFIGIDRKGARIWRGALTALEKQMHNVAFLRTRIELIDSFFSQGEVQSIWITFPDPHLSKSGEKHRLTSPRFLNLYSRFLKPDGAINLKTDSFELFSYTCDTIENTGSKMLFASPDLYNSNIKDKVLSIKTFYENQHLADGKKICYIKFTLPVLNNGS